MKLPSKVYDTLKWLCLIGLPSLTTCAAIVLKVWHICDENTINAIVTTSTAIATCLGGLIGISSINYKDGDKDGR